MLQMSMDIIGYFLTSCLAYSCVWTHTVYIVCMMSRQVGGFPSSLGYIHDENLVPYYITTELNYLCCILILS